MISEFLTSQILAPSQVTRRASCVRKVGPGEPPRVAGGVLEGIPFLRSIPGHQTKVCRALLNLNYVNS